MNTFTTTALTAVLALGLSACFGKKGPIDQERARLSSAGQDMTSEGEKMVSEGRALQNNARESRVVAASLRRQAEMLIAQGKPDEAAQVSLRADEQEAAAAASDSKGREMEQAGLAKIGAGQDFLNRSTSLEKQGEAINSGR